MTGRTTISLVAVAKERMADSLTAAAATGRLVTVSAVALAGTGLAGSLASAAALTVATAGQIKRPPQTDPANAAAAISNVKLVIFRAKKRAIFVFIFNLIIPQYCLPRQIRKIRRTGPNTMRRGAARRIFFAEPETSASSRARLLSGRRPRVVAHDFALIEAHFPTHPDTVQKLLFVADDDNRQFRPPLFFPPDRLSHQGG